MTAVKGAKGAFGFRELLPTEHWFFGALAQNSAIYGQTILAASMVNFLGLFTSFFIMTVYDRVLPNQAL